MKNLLVVSSLWLLVACTGGKSNLPVTPSESDLQFPNLATTWDEGMPLGNATVGALIWQRDSALRLSLDRTDLWDLRPMDSISGPNNRFAWVCEQVKKKTISRFSRNMIIRMSNSLPRLKYRGLRWNSHWSNWVRLPMFVFI